MTKDAYEIDTVDIALMSMVRKKPRGVAASAAALRVGIPMRAVVKSFRKLRKMQLVRENGSVLFLTRAGRQWILNNQDMFAFTGHKAWRDVPEEFMQPQIRPFAPYAPKRSKVSKSIFSVEG